MGEKKTTPTHAPNVANGDATPNGSTAPVDCESVQKVDFILTDLHPHIDAWSAAAKKSEHLGYVPESVDASNAPKDLIDRAEKSSEGPVTVPKNQKQVFRLFNLAFHHFDDELAAQILRNTLETADGFG